MVVASNCGSAAFQKKLKTLITSASHQKALSTNTPRKASAANSEALRTMVMR